jgi:CheY-like chemotaxis protein
MDMDRKILNNKRIVIVEDNVTNMAVYSVAFKLSGAVTIQDPYNTNTLDRIKLSLPVDAILLDLMLRYNMTGYEIFDKLKADPALADIPVIAISAADPAIEIPKAKAKGFAGFIGKPIDPAKLVEQVAACINGEEIWFTYEGTKGFS